MSVDLCCRWCDLLLMPDPPYGWRHAEGGGTICADGLHSAMPKPGAVMLAPQLAGVQDAEVRTGHTEDGHIPWDRYDRRRDALRMAIDSHGPAAGKDSDRCFVARAAVFMAWLETGDGA